MHTDLVEIDGIFEKWENVIERWTAEKTNEQTDIEHGLAEKLFS